MPAGARLRLAFGCFHKVIIWRQDEWRRNANVRQSLQQSEQRAAIEGIARLDIFIPQEDVRVAKRAQVWDVFFRERVLAPRLADEAHSGKPGEASPVVVVVAI